MQQENEQSSNAGLVTEAAAAAQRAHLLARAALIIACMAIAIAILGLFLPI